MWMHTCVYFVWGGGGWSHGAALCRSHLPPHSTDTQGNGRRGGGFILEKGIGVQWSNGQQCWFYWWAKGKGHWLGVWKPIYPSIWQNSGPPLSSAASACLIRHAHPWNYALYEKGVYILHTCTHRPGANVSPNAWPRCGQRANWVYKHKHIPWEGRRQGCILCSLFCEGDSTLTKTAVSIIKDDAVAL